MKKDLLKLLDNVQENNVEAPQPERYMLIDGLNLFFRNFSIINAVNSNGAHVGGLGGFFRSLGALTRQIQPTQIIVVFDGVGSSNNRKNIIPEYKSNRNLTRVTKHELFDNIDEEDDAKVSQIVRIIEYLQTLPVKVISLDRVEADDIIAHLSSVLPQKEDEKVFIVSSDKDYLQLGIKGLGAKTLFKKFPELTTEHLSFDDIIELSEQRMEEHVVYARILHDIEMLENKYKIMDLSNPMMTDDDKEYIAEFIKPFPLELHAKEFINMYNEDQLGGLIRNVEFWIKDIFQNLVTSK